MSQRLAESATNRNFPFPLVRKIAMRMRAILIFVAGLIFSSAAFAGTATGQVTKITVRSSDGLILFFVSGPSSGSPACARYSYWLIKDENSGTGKRQVAMLLAARATGQSITVYGTGACSRWFDGEDVDAIEM